MVEFMKRYSLDLLCIQNAVRSDRVFVQPLDVLRQHADVVQRLLLAAVPKRPHQDSQRRAEVLVVEAHEGLAHGVRGDVAIDAGLSAPLLNQPPQVACLLYTSRCV